MGDPNFLQGLVGGFAQTQSALEDRALKKATLDLQQKKFKIEEQESALKMQMVQQQIQQQGGILAWLDKLMGAQAGGTAPGIEAPAMGQPVPPMAIEPGAQAPTAGGLQLEGVSISKEGPTLRIGRPEKPSDTDRLALSMFGVPFTQLDQQRQQTVLRTEQERKVEISAAQGAAGVLAKGEAGLDLPLGPEDLGKLILPGGQKLPFGITGRQAIEAGAIPVSAVEQAQRLALEATEAILKRLDSQVDKIFTVEGFQGRVTSAFTNTQALLTQQTDAVLYESLKEGILANMVRTFGERGTLTDQDIARARNLLPNYAPRFGQLPDTKTAAREKMKQLRELIAEIGLRSAPGAGKPIPPKPVPAGGTALTDLNSLQRARVQQAPEGTEFTLKGQTFIKKSGKLVPKK